MLQATPHMPPFTAFQKSQFSEVSGTLREGPWGPGEVEMTKFFKILNGLDQTLPMIPHVPKYHVKINQMAEAPK